MMGKVELLAPAGNPEKLKIACLYGADAVYVGGREFGLRARAANFTREELKEAAAFIRKANKKLYVTVNIIPHDEDLESLRDYLRFLSEIKVNGIIVSSLYIASVAREVTPELELHLSTQASVSNRGAVAFYKKQGFKRIVLARELDLKEIESITSHASHINTETEVFIHGGMCISYSGRCMLSNYMTGRDANRGGCAHCCRWNYDLYRNTEKVNKDPYNMGSCDLAAFREIFALIKSGVTALKIEGRMRSLFYIAQVVRTYRTLIDDFYRFGGDKKKVDFAYYHNELRKAENRPTSVGFLNGPVTMKEQLGFSGNENPTKDFLGIVKAYDEASQTAIIEQRNYFKEGDIVEFFGPHLPNTAFKLGKLYLESGEETSLANHPLEIIRLRVPFPLSENDMVRKSKDDIKQ